MGLPSQLCKHFPAVNRKSLIITHLLLHSLLRQQHLAHPQYPTAAQPILIDAGLETFVAIFTNIWPLALLV